MTHGKPAGPTRRNAWRHLHAQRLAVWQLEADHLTWLGRWDGHSRHCRRRRCAAATTATRSCSERAWRWRLLRHADHLQPPWWRRACGSRGCSSRHPAHECRCTVSLELAPALLRHKLAVGTGDHDRWNGADPIRARRPLCQSPSAEVQHPPLLLHVLRHVFAKVLLVAVERHDDDINCVRASLGLRCRKARRAQQARCAPASAEYDRERRTAGSRVSGALPAAQRGTCEEEFHRLRRRSGRQPSSRLRCARDDVTVPTPPTPHLLFAIEAPKCKASTSHIFWP